MKKGLYLDHLHYISAREYKESLLTQVFFLMVCWNDNSELQIQERIFLDSQFRKDVKKHSGAQLTWILEIECILQ